MRVPTGVLRLNKVFKTWCGACQRLLSDIQRNGHLLKPFADKVIFVNIDQEGDPVDSIQHENSRYFPRCFGYGSDGKYLKYIRSSSIDYPYYYSSTNEIVNSLNKLLTPNAGVAAGTNANFNNYNNYRYRF
ncbi:hypothetical protein Bhyg_15874 [Pseudolycoriella hygida]|uniref:Thioredoxin domain-containing protein n=1 Tax=Pseudolycoriella hygida TaxID=35572 RepID=A0A9Q0RTI1_9DIPT|nr:hypothetical protein Bhyg_15874 [Pseudolycoriella hygida]